MCVYVCVVVYKWLRVIRTSIVIGTYRTRIGVYGDMMKRYEKGYVVRDTDRLRARIGQGLCCIGE